MTRAKKSRKATGFIDDSGPSRQERLADPDSYDSRRRKAQAAKKKNKSVYDKAKDAQKSGGDKPQQRKTRLQDKIKALNAEKDD